MKKRMASISFLLAAALLFWACGGDSAPQQPAAGESAATSQAAKPRAQAPATAVSGLQKISDLSDAWSALYKKNEKAINDYDGMPIMGLVTPALTFASSVQFDLLNLNNQEGRFEGRMMLAGYQGFVEKAGAKITFGYDDTLKKDGFGPTAKANDRVVANGFLALGQEYFREESFTERAGKKIVRNLTEFKRLGDGSMICLALSGHSINFRGDEELSDDAIFLHNGPGRYDFVIAKAKTGPEFKSITFAEQGDLTKEKAVELFKAAGYTIEKSGGLRDGKLALDQ